MGVVDRLNKVGTSIQETAVHVQYGTIRQQV